MPTKALSLIISYSCVIWIAAASRAEPPASPARHAVIVGVNDYDHANLSRLRYAGNDAARLAELLHRHGYEVTLLTGLAAKVDPNRAPTKANIERALDQALTRFKKGDTLLFCAAGHGVQFDSSDSFFCPQDAKPFADETATMISLNGLYGKLAKAYDGTKLVMIDACRSDLSRAARGIDGKDAPSPPAGVGVLLSCSDGEQSFEHDDIRHGVFFHQVIRGLEGAARNGPDVTWDSLRSFVKKEVPLSVRKLFADNRQQRPNELSNLNDVPVLVRANEAVAVSGKTRALLIGVSADSSKPVADTVLLERALVERAGLEKTLVNRLSLDRMNLVDQIPQWLKSAKPEDTFIIAWFGPTALREKKVFFDTGSGNSMLPVDWLREQLARCSARRKIIFLDAAPYGAETAEALRQVPGIVVVTSCSPAEKSHRGREQESLFGSALGRALEGHADEDGNGIVDSDELYAYVSATVSRIAQERNSSAQRPARFAANDVMIAFPVSRPMPLPLTSILDEVYSASAMDALVREVRNALADFSIKDVAVPEFAHGEPEYEELRGPIGLLGRWITEDFEKRIAKAGAGKFSVVERGRLQLALVQERTTVAELRNSVMVRRLSERLGGTSAFIFGKVRGRNGNTLSLQLKLVRCSDNETLATFAVTAKLKESDWAMLGRSAVADPADRVVKMPINDKPVKPVEQLVVATLEDRSRQAHPLSDPRFPYRVRVFVGGRERQGRQRGNEWIVKLREGEEYELEIENNSGKTVMMRLLVDGLNTLPEKIGDSGSLEVAHRVRLEEARPWILDPADATKFTVPGFATSTGANAEIRKFRVVGADKSVAAVKHYTEQIGIITAAFYSTRSPRKPIGTDFGGVTRANLRERKDLDVNDLLAVVHLRYVDADE